jgi:hypothetical protein
MNGRIWILCAALWPAVAAAGLDDWLKARMGGNPNDAATLSAGLKQALEQGAERAVATLGRENGFYRHPELKIPMPEKLRKIEAGLRRLGQDKRADEFVLSLNRAAEAALPQAREVLLDAIRTMSIEDAVGIVKGPPDAATRYFRARSENTLTQRFAPIVVAATDRVGVTRRYKQLVSDSGMLARLVDTRDLDIDAYITRQALDGLFHLIADEEKRIREQPVARTTELLRQVFGASR